MSNTRVRQQIIGGVIQVAALVVLALGISACSSQSSASPLVDNQTQVLAGGDPKRGARAIQSYGCGACHSIPGIAGANAMVGPPLDDWAERRFIAGSLPNQPEYLIEWIRFPQAIEPGNAMPNLGVSEQEARDISAYLFTLGDK